MGTLTVSVSEDCVSWTDVWSRSGDQGNQWIEASVDLSAYAGKTISIRFEGVTGSGYRSDMAVDAVSVTTIPAVPCTVDSDCDDGLFCNGSEVCVNGLCQAGAVPCGAGQYCNEDADTCEDVDCFTDADCDDGNGCTVDTCVDRVCQHQFVRYVGSYPYAEGFESGWGQWVNGTGDDIDWVRNSGPTPSSGTGPSAALSGTDYLYIE